MVLNSLGIFAKSEVKQFNLVAVIDHYVFRLYISVDNALSVTVGDGTHYLLHVCADPLFRVVCFLGQVLK